MRYKEAASTRRSVFAPLRAGAQRREPYYLVAEELVARVA